jgi:pyrimidine deaminase RibD-like protein
VDMLKKSLLDAMEQSLVEAARSEAEDANGRPRVAASLIDPITDKVIVSAHRGEERGAHAEYLLFTKAEQLGISSIGKILVTTLEPCVQRGAGKIPCVERVILAGIRTVYIGTLDPNPFITGRGELQLSYAGVEVSRYPLSIANQLRELNRDFFEVFRKEHSSIRPPLQTIIPAKSIVSSARKSSDRNRLLQATLDMISVTRGDLRIRAGDLSWLREAYVTLLAAALDGRRIQFLTTPPDPSEGREDTYWSTVQAAESLGAEVRRTDEGTRLKYTIAADPESMAAILIDRDSSSLLVAGEDDGLIDIVGKDFDSAWGRSSPFPYRSAPTISQVAGQDLMDALRNGVPQYTYSEITQEDVAMADVRPLTQSLERFKLARLSQLNTLRKRHNIAPAAIVEGCPWPITPPVVEDWPGIGFVLVDGTHRVYSAIEDGLDHLPMLVIRDVRDDLPADPVASWDEVQVHLTKLPRERRYSNYRKEHFRPLRWAFSRLATTVSDGTRRRDNEPVS